MISTIILSALAGFLLGMLLCYGKTLLNLYQHKDQISAGADLIGAGQNFLGTLGIKL